MLHLHIRFKIRQFGINIIISNKLGLLLQLRMLHRNRRLLVLLLNSIFSQCLEVWIRPFRRLHSSSRNFTHKCSRTTKLLTKCSSRLWLSHNNNFLCKERWQTLLQWTMQEVYFFFRNFHFKKYLKKLQVVLRQLSIHRLASLITVFSGLSTLLLKIFENNSFNFSDTTARWECILRLSRLSDR